MKTNADKKPRLPIFRERLDRLRGDLSYAEFAKKLGISRATMGFYLAGERVPNAIDLKRIAEQCHVSTDYLLGMTDAASAENNGISAALGLSDKAIDVLRQASKNVFRKTAYNKIIENEKILRYITNYLLAFLEEERAKSRFRNVPISKPLSAGYADVNLVRLIELLPLWKKSIIDELKEDTATFDYLLTKYVANIADVPMCEYESGMVDLDEEPYMPNSDDILPDDFYEDVEIDHDKAVAEYERDLEEKHNAIVEILYFLNGGDGDGDNPKTRERL